MFREDGDDSEHLAGLKVQQFVTTLSPPKFSDFEVRFLRSV